MLRRYEKGLPDHEEVIFDLHSASVSRGLCRSLNCTEWQHADLNYADELAKRSSAGSADRFTGTVRVQSLFDAKEPSGRAVARLLSARSAIGLAHPSAWPDLDRHRCVGWVQQMGRPCSGDSQGRRRLDSGRRQALAWCNAHHHDDAPSRFRSNWTAER